MIKTVKFLRVLSVILFLGTLALVYAYLPIQVQLTEEKNQLVIHRENFFYFAVVFFLVINLLAVLMTNLLSPWVMLKGGEQAVAWLAGLGFVINIYLSMLMGFIGVLNNQAHVSTSGFAYLNYIGPVLILVWIIGIFYLIKSPKESA